MGFSIFDFVLFLLKFYFCSTKSIESLSLKQLSVKAGMGNWGTEWGNDGNAGNQGGNAGNQGGDAGNGGGNVRIAENAGNQGVNVAN